MSTRRVRSATVDDLPALLGLYTELAEGDPARGPGDAERATSALKRILGEEDHHLYVVADGSEVLGAAELVVVANLTQGAHPWAVVENVIVSRSARGQGAGSELLQALLDVARDEGCYKVQLLSGKQRGDAHRLYRRIGFEAVAEGFKLYLDGTRARRRGSPDSPS